MKRSKPMTRTGFKRKEPRSLNPFSSGSMLKRSAKKRRPVTGIDGKYLSACKGEPCYLRVPGVCCGRLDTVVPCHSNEMAHGKGMGITARHEFTVPGCVTCHSWLDQGTAPKQEKFGVWRAAYARWESMRSQKMGLMEESA